VTIVKMLESYFVEIDRSFVGIDRTNLSDPDPVIRTGSLSILAVNLQKLSEQIARNGYVRAQFNSLPI
jgi:hypothetical protein